MQKVTSLPSNYLFDAFNEKQKKVLIQHMHIVTLSAHDILFNYGDNARCFYFLKSGTIKLYRVSSEGSEKVIDIITDNRFFAEATVFRDIHEFPVTAEAISDSVLYSIENEAFKSVLSESSEACFHLLATMSIRLHYLLTEIDHLTLQNATVRVASYINHEAHISTSENITLPAPKTVIAAKLSITPETLSRILHQMHLDGILTVHGRQITINDLPKLKQHILT